MPTLLTLLACLVTEPPHAKRKGARSSTSSSVPVPPSALVPVAGTATTTDRPNVLFILLDDVGIDKVAPWSSATDAPLVPHIARLADEGLLFRNAYAAPVCQAGRAAFLTGRYARRTGVGANTNPGEEGWILRDDEGTVAHVLRHAGYSTALVGKWHIANYATPLPLTDPLRRGFDRWRGTFANLYDAVDTPSVLGRYTSWEKVDDGETWAERRYVTTVQVDDVLSFVGSLPEPWFVWWAPNAAHDPYQPPPDSVMPSTAAFGTKDAYHDILLAFDVELGRLRVGLGEDRLDRTMLVLSSDNGTPSAVISEPYNSGRGKTTVYDGGSHVPLLWRGPGVAIGETDALVHAVDLLPTLADLIDVDPAWSPSGPKVRDGASYLPVLLDPTKHAHTFLVTEDFSPNGNPVEATSDRVAARDDTFRLVYDVQRGTEQFFRYAEGAADEGPDLLPDGLTPEEEAAKATLRTEIDAFVATVQWIGP